MKGKQKFFEAWGETDFANSLLKGLVVLCALIICALAASCCILALRPVQVAIVSNQATHLTGTTKVPIEIVQAEAERVVRRYVAARYSWTPDTIADGFASATALVAKQGREALHRAALEQTRLAKEKGLSQRVHILSVEVGAGSSSAKVLGDRVVSVGGVRGVVPFETDLKLQSGERTPESPEGFFIANELVPEDAADSAKGAK